MTADGRPGDTRREAWEVQLEVFRRMGITGRLEAALRQSDEMRALLGDGVRLRHASYTADEVELAVKRLLLGDELFREAFPGVDVTP